jgi:ADP-heptose:LPS heptosyltransferase
VGYGTIPHTYIGFDYDVRLYKNYNTPYVAVFHGSLTTKKAHKKDVGVETRRYIIKTLVDNGCSVVLLGGKKDDKQFWKDVPERSLKTQNAEVLDFIGKLRLLSSVSILNCCDYFISNDTGLYHAAVALRKRGLVLWKDTPLTKNRSPGSYAKYAICPSPYGNLQGYKKYIDQFAEQCGKREV